MIKGRPAYLLEQENYRGLPTEPFSILFDVLPELLRESIGPLGGIQPVTGVMMESSNNALRDMPSEAEIALFRELGAEFQMISVVINLAHLKTENSIFQAIPYSLTLIPAQKRGMVDQRGIDDIAKLDAQKFISETQPCYADMDPFSGEWSLFAPLSTLIGERQYSGYLDELGLVVAQYFLVTKYDPGDVLEAPLHFVNPRAEEKYRRKRANLLYTPFSKVHARRIWGAESPIELFLFQELVRRGASPTLQMLLYDDGSMHSSLYHLWRDIEFRNLPGQITEADMYFPEERLAVFCDSNKFHRSARARAKDKAIDERLATTGVKTVRIPGPLIQHDLKMAGNLVFDALTS